MPKGKKFDAAEKHFMKKETAYRKEIRELSDQNKKLIQKANELESENERLNDWVERLLKYTELSPEQLKEHIQDIKKMAKMSEMTDVLKLVNAYRQLF